MWLTLCCSGGSNAGTPHQADFDYTFSKPDRVYPLPISLREISGISHYDDSLLACIQDEKGVIFFFNTRSGRLIGNSPFWKNGDFEDVEVVGKDCYVVKSNGTLFKVSDFRKASPKVEKLTTPLCDKNDVEGLSFHSASRSLWLACKGSSKICDDKGHKRAIYAWPLKKGELKEEAVFKMNLKHLEEDLDKKDVRHFAPSGIAIHPITGDIYVISSVGKQLLIFFSNKEFKNYHSLKFSHMSQPEGISFAPNGDLYISNEGRSGGANILYFKYLARP